MGMSTEGNVHAGASSTITALKEGKTSRKLGENMLLFVRNTISALSSTIFREDTVDGWKWGGAVLLMASSSRPNDLAISLA